jgi:nitrite reductase/ring-hydroxylating ferredoxin subunit
MKVQLAEEVEVRENELKELDFFGRPAIAFKQEGRVTVYLNMCTHLGGPLQLGEDKVTLTCQWHGACFAARSGKAICKPAPSESHLIRLPTRIEDGKIFYVYGE